jgi:hypothetical protein
MSSIINGKGKGCRLASMMLAAALFMSPGFCSVSQAASKKVRHVEKQKVFSSPEEAVKAFIGAVKEKDAAELVAIFGPGSYDLIHSGDKVADNQTRLLVIKAFDEKNKIDKVSDKKAVLDLGRDDWPMPIPMVEENGKWRFDTNAGRREILDRRIGRNELGAIQCCRDYVEAQRGYASKIHNDAGLFEYARKFISTPGKKDGLYWKTAQGQEPSPLSIFMANAAQLGYGRGSNDQPGVFEGYRYRILTGQGANARGGAFNYVVRGRMTGGFALVAFPAKYGASGVMTFIVNNQGVVYEKDLGPKTQSRAGAMKLFDPDKSWKKVE